MAGRSFPTEPEKSYFSLSIESLCHRQSQTRVPDSSASRRVRVQKEKPSIFFSILPKWSDRNILFLSLFFTKRLFFTEIQLQRITGDRADSKLNNFALGGTKEVRRQGNLRGRLSSRLNIILQVLLYCSQWEGTSPTSQNNTSKHSWTPHLFKANFTVKVHILVAWFFIGCFSEMTGAKAGTRALGSVGGVCVCVCVCVHHRSREASGLISSSIKKIQHMTGKSLD